AGVVRRESAVDGLGMFPQARRDELAEKPFAFQHLADLGDIPFGFLGRQAKLDGVVIVELNAVEAEFAVFADFGGERQLLASRRTERIGAGADIPGAERESIGRFSGNHSSFLPVMPITRGTSLSGALPSPQPNRNQSPRSLSRDRCFVSRLSIHCASCNQTWSVTNKYSLYEQQAVESCPCPRCGAYTLCCQMPSEQLPFE